MYPQVIKRKDREMMSNLSEPWVGHAKKNMSLVIFLKNNNIDVLDDPHCLDFMK